MSGERYWLDEVLERNQARFERLPVSIRETQFSSRTNTDPEESPNVG